MRAITGKTGNYEVPNGTAARCPECGAWIHVGGPRGLQQLEAIDRFWAEHLERCGWAPPARTILGHSLGLAPFAAHTEESG